MPDLRQHGLGLGGGQIPLRPARDQHEQQLMQLAHHPGVVLTQRAALVDQDTQDRELLVPANSVLRPASPRNDRRRWRTGRHQARSPQRPLPRSWRSVCAGPSRSRRGFGVSHARSPAFGGLLRRRPVTHGHSPSAAGDDEAPVQTMFDLGLRLVGRGGVEPPTFHFSGGRSYQLSYLPKRAKLYNRAVVRPESVRSTGAMV